MRCWVVGRFGWGAVEASLGTEVGGDWFSRGGAGAGAGGDGAVGGSAGEVVEDVGRVVWTCAKEGAGEGVEGRVGFEEGLKRFHVIC